jgi:flagellar biosynthesis regulator FlaF
LSAADSDGEGSFVVLSESQHVTKELGTKNAHSNSPPSHYGQQQQQQQQHDLVEALEKEKQAILVELDNLKTVVRTRDAFIEELQEERNRLEEENREASLSLKRLKDIQKNLDTFDTRASTGAHSRQVRVLE